MPRKQRTPSLWGDVCLHYPDAAQRLESLLMEAEKRGHKRLADASEAAMQALQNDLRAEMYHAFGNLDTDDWIDKGEKE